MKDFERFSGFLAKIELLSPLEGRKRFQGKLGSVSGTSFELQTETGTVSIPLGQIAKAKLVLTDELIKAYAASEDQARDANM
jgi:ribosome maturation factor RimP